MRVPRLPLLLLLALALLAALVTTTTYAHQVSVVSSDASVDERVLLQHHTQTNADVDTEAEAETDAEAEAETSVEAEGGVDAESEVNAEADADAETESDAEGESESESGVDVESLVDTLLPQATVDDLAAVPVPELAARSDLPALHSSGATEQEESVFTFSHAAAENKAYHKMRFMKVHNKEGVPRISPYAQRRRDLSHSESRNYCSSFGFQLCASTSICRGEKPVGGARRGKRAIPVSDAKGTWIHVGEKKTCQLISKPEWGTHVFHKVKGFVACCDEKGHVVSAHRLSKYEGHLVRDARNGAIYMVEDGAKRHIPDPRTFEAMGFSWRRAANLDAAKLDAIPTGAAFPKLNQAKGEAAYQHPNLGFQHHGGRTWDKYEGVMIKSKKSPAVYLVERGVKRHIPNPVTFEAMGCEWKLIRTISSVEVEQIPLGHPFKAVKEGTAKNSKPYVHPRLGDFHQCRSLPPRKVNAADFIRATIPRLLGREAVQRDFNNFLPDLKANGDVKQYLRAVMTTKEFRSRFVYPRVVKALYRQFLGRAPRAGGLKHHVKSLAYGDVNAPIKDKVREFANMRERKEKFFKNNEDGAVNNYKQILARNPTNPANPAAWAAYANTHGFEATNDKFLESAEYVQRFGENAVPGHPNVYRKLVKRLFRSLLNRKPGDKSLVAWQAVMRNSKGYTRLVDGLLNSAEFTQKCGTDRFYDQEGRKVVLAKKD